MRRTAVFSRIVAVLALSSRFLLLDGCSRKTTKHRDLDGRIQTELKYGAAQIDLGKIATGFAWDRVLVLNPYFPKDEMCKNLVLTAQQCSRLDFEYVDEGEFLLVFASGKEVTRLESVSRATEFEESERCIGKPFARDAAVFTVSRKQRTVLMCPR